MSSEQIKVTTSCDDRGYVCIVLENDDGAVHIQYAGTLDLYWSYIPKNRSIMDIDVAEFEIAKSEKVLYPMFAKLYRAVVTNRPFSNLIYDGSSRKFKGAPYQRAEKIGLVKDGIVTWASDDSPLESASWAEMEKTEKGITLRFRKGYLEYGFPTMTVRFRNSGSRYDWFVCAFMGHYQALVHEFG